MKTLTQYAELVNQPNIAAFLRVIREGETNQTAAAYKLINGGATFSDMTHHPFNTLKTTQGGKAAGAYQYIPTTWAALTAALPGGDYSAAWQDTRCVQLLDDCGALDQILNGSVAAAIVRLRPIWTSLPGAAENSGRYTLADAITVYMKYGGQLHPVGTATPAPAPAPKPVPAPAPAPTPAPGPAPAPVVVPTPTPKPAPAPAPAPTPPAPKAARALQPEELTDVPAAQTAALAAQFRAAGGTVTTIPQPDGLFTVRATYEGTTP